MGLDMHLTASRKLSRKRKCDKEVIAFLDSHKDTLVKADEDNHNYGAYLGAYASNPDAVDIGSRLNGMKIFGIPKTAKIDIVRLVDDTWELQYEVMYWRKANQIHQWFVDNVQNSVDDCGSYPVDSCQLEELLYDIDLVLGDHRIAEDVLPTQNGFFFGGTEYDDYYYADLRDTKRSLKPLLKRKMYKREDMFQLRYTSSW